MTGVQPQEQRRGRKQSFSDDEMLYLTYHGHVLLPHLVVMTNAYIEDGAMVTHFHDAPPTPAAVL